MHASYYICCAVFFASALSTAYIPPPSSVPAIFPTFLRRPRARLLYPAVFSNLASRSYTYCSYSSRVDTPLLPPPLESLNLSSTRRPPVCYALIWFEARECTSVHRNRRQCMIWLKAKGSCPNGQSSISSIEGHGGRIKVCSTQLICRKLISPNMSSIPRHTPPQSVSFYPPHDVVYQWLRLLASEWSVTTLDPPNTINQPNYVLQVSKSFQTGNNTSMNLMERHLV